jgi:hypothetical protein
MLSKFFDKFCFTTLFLVLAVLVLGGFQLSSVFKNGKGGRMAESSLVLPRRVGPWTRSDSPKVVTAETIFDYMNGAGELYLGYRFDRCDVYEYTAPAQKEILVEVYFMKSSDDAFGLISLDWGGESVDGFDWPRALYGEGLLRLWADNIYARVMATQETPGSREAVLAIGQVIAEGRDDALPPRIMRNLPGSLLTNWALRRDRASFFRTHLVLNSLYYLSHQNILELDLACEAAAVLYERDESASKRSRIQVIWVKYPGMNRAKEALKQFHEAYLADHPFPSEKGPSGEITDVFAVEDSWMGYTWKEESIVLVFQCPDRETAVAVLERL